MEVKIYFTPFSYSIPGMLPDPVLTFICWGFGFVSFCEMDRGCFTVLPRLTST